VVAHLLAVVHVLRKELLDSSMCQSNNFLHNIRGWHPQLPHTSADFFHYRHMIQLLGTVAPQSPYHTVVMNSIRVGYYSATSVVSNDGRGHFIFKELLFFV
jgi:hypothetical protein